MKCIGQAECIDQGVSFVATEWSEGQTLVESFFHPVWKKLINTQSQGILFIYSSAQKGVLGAKCTQPAH